jgi:hypothetical protein
MYYQFTYATYPEGTRLPTFTRNLTPAASAALDKADAIVRDCGERALQIRVTYHSDGRSGRSFTVQYDSAYSNDLAGRYHESARIDVSEKPGFHTALVKCPRARLGGHQNNSADFRIAAAGGDVAIADVQVEQDQ